MAELFFRSSILPGFNLSGLEGILSSTLSSTLFSTLILGVTVKETFGALRTI